MKVQKNNAKLQFKCKCYCSERHCKMIKISEDKIKFKRKIYKQKGIYYITYKKYWDGGFNKDTSLSDKADFYRVANLFSDAIKRIVCTLNDYIVIGNRFAQKECLFESWTDKKSYDCYNNLKSYTKKNKSYALKCPEDDLIIDYIVENNFRYLTCIDLYLSNSKVVLQPTCHSELFIYAKDYNKILPVLKEITENSKLVLSKNIFD